MGLQKGFDRNGLVTALISSCHGWLLIGGGNLDPTTFSADSILLLWYRLYDIGLCLYACKLDFVLCAYYSHTGTWILIVPLSFFPKTSMQVLLSVFNVFFLSFCLVCGIKSDLFLDMLELHVQGQSYIFFARGCMGWSRCYLEGHI